MLVARQQSIASRSSKQPYEGEHHKKLNIGSNARDSFSVPGAGRSGQHPDRGDQKQRSATAAAYFVECCSKWNQRLWPPHGHSGSTFSSEDKFARWQFFKGFCRLSKQQRLNR